MNAFTLDTTECGNTWGCVLYPKDCLGTGCTYGLAYKLDTTTQSIMFKTFAEATGYVAIAMSEDAKMVSRFILL
jgi:hypothetical protein